MSTDLFAGVPVRDRAVAIAWYDRLFGAEPAFLPNDAEAVWQVTEHGYVYVVVRPQDAGHGVQTVFAADYDTRLAAIAGRGLQPTSEETYDNGVRKALFHDPDGNEFGFGGPPV